MSNEEKRFIIEYYLDHKNFGKSRYCLLKDWEIAFPNSYITLNLFKI